MSSLRVFWYLYFILGEAKKINRHLRISSFLNPLINYHNQTTFDIGYIEEDYVRILAKYMNFTFEVIPPQDALLPGFIVNGSWTGMIGQLQRKEVDMGVTLTDDYHAKHSVVDTTFAVQYVGAAIIIPYPHPGFKTYLLRYPFDRTVWLLLFVTAIFLTTTLCLTSLDLCKLFGKKHYIKMVKSVAFWFFVYIGIFTYQDKYLRNKRYSFRLAFATMLLTSLVLSNLYTSVFTSMLAVPYFKLLANSIEEVAKNENIRVHAYNSSGTTDYVLGAQTGCLKQLGKQWSRNPRQLVASELFEMAKIVRGNNVFITTDSVAENFVESLLNKYKHCRITLAREKFYERGQSMSLPKGSYLTPLLNEQILRMKQAGLIEYSERSRESARRNACKLKRKDPSKQLVNILIEDLGGAFVLLLLGYLISLTAFVLELVMSRLVVM